MEQLTAGGQTDLLTNIQAAAPRKRFQPVITTNRMAQLCMQGKRLPDEANEPSWGSCPLLSEDRCLIYPVRPFGCRSMVSLRDCRLTGAADMDPFPLTVNNLFLQIIEHLDRPGFSGNLTDVLLFLHTRSGRRHYKTGIGPRPDGALLPNTAIPGLLIPPEHGDKIAPLLAQLQQIIAAR